MKKLILTFAIVGMIFTSCKKDEAKPQLETVDYISTAYMLGSNFVITSTYYENYNLYFTVKDDKYITSVNVIECTRFKVGDKITGVQLNAILQENNYQIPHF